MALSAILLGLINIAIVVAILLLVGAVILWFCSWMQLNVPANVQTGLHHRRRADRALHAGRAAARHSDYPHHQRALMTLSRETWHHFYGGYWQRRRRLHLLEHPLCKFCADGGVVTRASVVDHVEPHRGDWNKFVLGDLQSLCKRPATIRSSSGTSRPA